MLDWQSLQRPFVLEIERGVLTLNVLSQLTERRYGYQIIQNLVDAGLAVDQGMIYPLLRKLEQHGLLVGDWIVGDTRPRRYYVLSEDGRSLLTHLAKEWKRIASIEDEFIRNDTEKEK
jgi:PadR family transcriptional regulator, regulatory protein PadR